MRRTFAAAAVLAAGLALFAGRASGTTKVSFFDPSFGNAGRALYPTGDAEWATGLAEADGKQVVVGTDGRELLLARYTAAGSLDSSFGTNGTVTTNGLGSQALGFAVIADGDQYLVAGTDVSPTTNENAVLVARYNGDGSLDTTFGTGGFYSGDLPGDTNEAGYSIGVQSDGKIVVLVDHLEIATKQEWGVIRLNTNGTVDTSFATNGFFYTQTGGTDGGGSNYYLAFSLLVEPNDEILLAGESSRAMAAWELTADGSFDTSFGTNGWALGVTQTTLHDSAFSIVRQADGSFVLGGGRGFVPGNDHSDESFALERFSSSGHLDGSFGTGGVVTTQLGSNDDEIEALSQAPDGDLVAVGFSGALDSPDNTTWHEQFAVVRYHADGALDTAFGENGSAVTPGPGIWLGGAVMADGRVYAFGYNDSTAVVARYLSGLPALAMSSVSGVVGDVVRLTGPDVTSDDVVKIGNLTVPPDDVVVASPTELDVTIPPGAATGKISVATASGTATTIASFAVLPDVVSLSSAGPFTTGNKLGITGQTFRGLKLVKVGGVAWPFKIDSDSHVTATVPATAVSGVLTLGNVSGTTNADTLAIAPVIAGFAPGASVANGAVTITGAGLLGASVAFNGVPATIKSSTATRIVAFVPPTATVGTISVTTPEVLEATTLTSFKPIPKITSISQGREGDQVTISGTNLADCSSVKLGTAIAYYTPVDALSITATVPALRGGAWGVGTPGGHAASKRWYAAPTVTSFDPSGASVGARITIQGLDFAGASKVFFGATKASFRVASSTRITATVPAGAVSGAISVTNLGGTTQSADSFTVG